MSSSDDEDDKFLYGSDTEQALNAKRVLPDESNDQGSLAKRQKVAESSKNEENPSNISSENSSEGDGSDSDSSESESDSDVEFIIGTGTDTTRLDSSAVSNNATNAAQPSGITLATAPPEASTQSEDGTTVAKTDKTISPKTGTIDLNADGMYEGEPVTALDPEVLKEKPWRQPGANLSDYFNYGFNEYTWMEYLHRQEKLQQEYNPHKILMGLLTLQQHGNLNGPKKMDHMNNGSGDLSSSGSIKTNTPLNQHGSSRPMPPPGFPPLPMFGGFSPFPMPGMMPPMNPASQPKK